MNNKFFVVFFMIAIFSSAVYSKGNDDIKDNGANSNKPADQIQNKNERQEKKQDEMTDKDNAIIIHEKTLKNRDIVRYCISVAVESEKLANSINKEIKKADEDLSNINAMQLRLVDRVNEIYRQSGVLVNDIDDNERKFITDQLNEVEKIKSRLTSLLSDFDAEMKKERKNNGTLSNINRSIEKEIKKLSRQYRAVEWILFENK